MQKTAMLATLFLVIFNISVNAQFVNLRNPCHPNRRTLGDGSDCEVYRIPPRLCQACKLKDDNYDSQGKFLFCDSIYDLEDETCKAQLELYVKWNKCDKLRQRQMRNFNENLVPLDYLVYSVCEECCDCVTPKSKENEFFTRRRDGTLFNIKGRANCGTHAAADVCLVWPKVKAVVTWFSQIPSQAEVDALPNVCKVLRDWREARKGGQSSGLTFKERENVPDAAVPFLRSFANVAKCASKDVWQSCVRLEGSQKRI